MQLSGEALRLRCLSVPATLLLAAAALDSCSADADHPSVKAETTEITTAYLSNGKEIELITGTEVTALCVSGGPFNLRVEVDSGKYDGEIANGVPRANLHATSDPYNANKQTPPQDPFGPLSSC